MQRIAGNGPSPVFGRAMSKASDSPPGFEYSIPDSKTTPSGTLRSFCACAPAGAALSKIARPMRRRTVDAPCLQSIFSERLSGLSVKASLGTNQPLSSSIKSFMSRCGHPEPREDLRRRSIHQRIATKTRWLDEAEAEVVFTVADVNFSRRSRSKPERRFGQLAGMGDRQRSIRPEEKMVGD